jgi:hypothetical protein
MNDEEEWTVLFYVALAFVAYLVAPYFGISA